MKQKTAMMELIDEFNLILDNDQFDFSFKAGISSAMSKAIKLIRKEKQQIMEAYTQGYWDDGHEDFNPKQYYNETYKQD